MKRFADLMDELDATTPEPAKVAALQRYLALAPARDAAWAVYLLAGGKPRSVLRLASLRALACELAGLDDWLFGACYQAVGDLAETVAHVLPEPLKADAASLSVWLDERLLPLAGLPGPELDERIKVSWQQLDASARLLWIKLATGSFRAGLSPSLLQRALAAHAGLEPTCVAQRLKGFAQGSCPPTSERFAELLAPLLPGHAQADRGGQPYSLCLAPPLPAAESVDAQLGPISQWLVTCQYDGLRVQLVKRAGEVWLWSCEEELVSGQLPEILAQARELPDGTVLDGQLVVWHGPGPGDPSASGVPGSLASLQQRLGLKKITPRILAEAPVIFVAHDLLEHQGQDVRTARQAQRRAWLEALMAGRLLTLSPLLRLPDWTALARLREPSPQSGVQGFWLKHIDAVYGGASAQALSLWWHCKIEPMRMHGILLYAQAGRSSQARTDYTFAVWNRQPPSEAQAQAVLQAIARHEALPVRAAGTDLALQPLQLVTFAKACSGLTQAQLAYVDSVVRKTTVDKFGPVRSLQPTLVLELGFEGIHRSLRHKSGVVLRSPCMLRICPDKALHEAGSLNDLQRLLALRGGAASESAADALPGAASGDGDRPSSP